MNSGSGGNLQAELDGRKPRAATHCRWEWTTARATVATYKMMSLLADAGLPDDIGGWRLEDGATAAATVQGLIGRLPPCKIPDDIPAHSKLDLSSLRGAE